MHGIVHAELQKFVIARHGRPVWQELLKGAGLGSKNYLTSQQYPDADIAALVTQAATMTGKPASELLEDFGEFMVPDLMNMYRPLLKPEWRTLDLLEHTEGTIHSVVRLRNPGAAPPQLRFRRVDPAEVHLSYNSNRKMCAVARGIIRGVAKHFGESVTIVESACMHRGAPSCEISIRLAARSQGRGLS
ncbi:MAG TPA: heme NO-binding domain-containing protein [Gemmatimonadales bacterium]|nr:heme NO-binding domain-containing protein [Gemmatimonadales bacterium]